MDTVKLILLIAHLAAFAVIAAAPVIYNGAASTLQAWAARIQLLLGIALVVVLMKMGADPSHVKLGIKAIITVAVVACAEIAVAKARRGESSPLPWVAAGLALVNAGIAYLVH